MQNVIHERELSGMNACRWGIDEGGNILMPFYYFLV
jgi:hypothetical protein